MNKLLDKINKSSTIKDSALIKKSKVYGHKDIITTSVPMINVALSGDVDGGLTPGLTVLAGPSKHFKSAFALIMAAAYLKKYPDGVVLFYDSEFGTPEAYWETFDVDMDRVIHTPITDIEQLKHDIVTQLKNIERGDRICIVIDSIGNLASKKEIEDAEAGKSVADMTRAKALKSLWRMVTPHLTIKDIPLIAINHTYKEIGLFPKDIVAGGTGTVYSADNIWILGRQQEKDGTEIKGYHFIINVEKSRFVREKSKIPITCTWEDGVLKWSGLLDLAISGKYIVKPNAGWYQRVDEKGDPMGNKYRAKEIINDGDFWNDILSNTDFKEFIRQTYQIGGSKASAAIDEVQDGDDETEAFEEAEE